MLEIKNVTKVYRSKGGVATKALDDVSISFAETGLVFLLGKSGSGKSTLLNVSGGLDEPTSGEVIVKGKSSLDFSASDFDSYRNTFVGFIFQEYNILDEFNVEDNIALALELQGKPKDKQKIAGLLEEVDLAQYAKRKPNTLSGGQKQRIAIARALIKEPQIIMADEPTGALDSATGKQVFDTLKKLSETRLVIVVSHDREFAEIYGDRIVELKDGKIISDVSKTQVPPEELDENVTVIGGNTLNIKSGAKLTQKNVKTIQDFILNTEGDVIVTKGAAEIAGFKKANRMAEDGATERFEDTAADQLEIKQYDKDESKFIRSRLPARKAIKIGASGLKLKPVRLLFTILLSFIAFTMFGLFSTLMLYDGDSVAVNSFMESEGNDYLNLKKSYLVRETYHYTDGDSYTYDRLNPLGFTEKELEEFTSKYGAETFGYFALEQKIGNVSLKKSASSDYYRTEINSVAYVGKDGKLASHLIAGTYPQNTDEVCISSYMVEVFKNCDFYGVKDESGKLSVDTSSTLTVNSASDLVGKYLATSIGGGNNSNAFFKITGVFDSGKIPSTYDDLKETSSGSSNYLLSYQFESYIEEGMHLMAFVSEDFYDEYKNFLTVSSNSGIYINYFRGMNTSAYGKYYYESYDYSNDSWQASSNESTFYIYGGAAYTSGGANQLPVNFFTQGKTSLSDNEMVMGLYQLYSYDGLIYRQVMQYFMDEVKTNPSNYGFSGNVSDNYEVYSYCNSLYNQFDSMLRAYASGYYYDSGTSTDVKLGAEDRLEALEYIKAVMAHVGEFDVTLEIDGVRNVGMRVVGYYEADVYNSSDSDGYYAYFTQDFIDANFDLYDYGSTTYETNYTQEAGQKYSGIFVPYDHSDTVIKDVLGVIGIDNAKDNDVVYTLESSLYSSIEMANEYAEMLSTIFLWVGVAFAVFSALLLFNFISMSISSKRKEIGILRAVGARGLDVFKIFFAESGIIVGICTLLALVGAFVLSGVINTVLNNSLGLAVTLFVFGLQSVGLMIAIAVAVALVSTFLPVFFAARKKPVESIRAL